jgi:hypothetical protein
MPLFAMGQPFQAPEYELSIDAPSGWVHDEEDQFGYVLYDPSYAGKKRKIRIHYPGGKASTPKEQVQITLESINKGRKERSQTLERIQYQKQVTTKQGIEGYLASHGFEGEPDRGYINHYYFKTPSGRIVCICLYLSGATKSDESRLENIILNSLVFTPAKTENG